MRYILLFIAIILLTSCIGNTHQVTACLPDKTNWGFLGGLWHGMISPVTFIISIFDKDIAVFAVNNTGRWYTFGFLLGVGAFSSGATKSTS